MESQFDLVFTLIPIALVIALRLYAGRKKQAEEKERVRLASFLSKTATSESGPAKPLVAEFNAHDLAPDEAEDYSEAPAGFYGRSHSPSPYNADPSGFSGAGRVVVDSAAAPPPEAPVAPVAPAVGPGPTPPSGDGASSHSQPSDRLFIRLNSLGSLQRAVVMAELLGTPKGM